MKIDEDPFKYTNTLKFDKESRSAKEIEDMKKFLIFIAFAPIPLHKSMSNWEHSFLSIEEKLAFQSLDMHYTLLMKNLFCRIFEKKELSKPQMEMEPLD